MAWGLVRARRPAMYDDSGSEKSTEMSNITDTVLQYLGFMYSVMR
jgi:hypothetical protein